MDKRSRRQRKREREGRENKRLRASTTFRSISSLCHRCITITHLSYRFPISETSATALCGTMLLRVFGWSSNKKIQKGKSSVQPGGLPTSVTFCCLSVCGCHCVPSYPLSLFPPNSLSFARSTCTLHKRTKNQHLEDLDNTVIERTWRVQNAPKRICHPTRSRFNLTQS